MGAANSGITDVTAGNVAAVLDINQFKQALEGQRDFVPLIWATDTNNIVLRIGDAAGANFLDIQDSAGVSQFKVTSDGTITSTDVLTSTRLARLPTDVTVSNATLADVVGMSFSIGASEIWTMQMFGLFDAAGTPDIRVGFTGPAGCAMAWAHTGDPLLNAAGTTAYNPPDSLATSWDGAGQGAGVPLATTFAGTIVNGVTAGTIQLQYARAGASGSSTLKAETNIIFTKVS